MDTGFTGHLTLPNATVGALGLPTGSAESIPADGSLREDACLARVLWHGGERSAAPAADALLGMALMRGSEPRVECGWRRGECGAARETERLTTAPRGSGLLLNWRTCRRVTE